MIAIFTRACSRALGRVRALRSTLSAGALCGVLALGALGAGAAPARADGRDAAAVIGSIIALYAISRALDRPDGRAQAGQTFTPVRPPQVHAPAPARRVVVPERCTREFQTRDGYFRGYAANCLQRSVRATPPDACAREFRTDRGARVFYASPCMARYGWVEEGRRERR